MPGDLNAVLDKISQQIGFVPSLTAINLSPAMPLAAEDQANLPEEPYGLPPNWDYRTSPVGPKGEPLPNGAIGWNPHGEAFYGGNSAIGNWLKGFVSRINAPVSDDAPKGSDLAANSVNALMGW